MIVRLTYSLNYLIPKYSLMIIEYAIPVWFCVREIQELEKLHTSYIKRDQTPHLAVFGETGRTPLITHQHYTGIKYWCRIINLDEDHILKHINNSVLQTPNSKSWVNTVKCSLEWPVSLTHISMKYIPSQDLILDSSDK